MILAVSLILLLFISACASYPLARFKFKLAQPIYGLIVACMSIPVHITLIPVFKMSKATGLYDSIWALIGPYIAFAVPISVFILTSFMQEIPREIEESAEIDGCGKIQMFFSMILPLAKPGLATLAIYNGVNMWNEFSFAYTLTQSSPNRTLPLAIWEFQGQYSMNTPMIMAVLTLTLLPMIIMFIIFQDKLVKGMNDLKNLATDKSKMSFRGNSASEFLQCILSDVALNASRANTFYASFKDISGTIDNQRLSISGVDEDEEAVNLVKYQNGYNLASKMIQTLTEIYDRLILETGV